ncbi:MAG: DUF2442 domain-containing protein [Rudanella sp.]|nr:DUF2442 domain-containing protein [Rudanella sp.]
MTAPATTSRSTTAKKQTKLANRPTFSELPVLANVAIDSQWIVFGFKDGRKVNVPLNWSKKLNDATEEQRNNVIVSELFAFWDDVDEIIGVENVLFGDRLYK